MRERRPSAESRSATIAPRSLETRARVRLSLDANMTQPVLITPQTHAARAWCRASDLKHASPVHLVPVGASEVADAALHLPQAFIVQEAVVSLVAVCGLVPGQSLMVDVNGRWLAGYVPQALKGYPFDLQPTTNKEELALTYHEAHGYAEPGAADALPFFDADGQPAEAVRKGQQFLLHVLKERQQLMGALNRLKELNLLKPLELTVSLGERQQRIDGLHTVDEQRFRELAGDDLTTLHQTGLYTAAVLQMVSMRHLPALVKRYQALVARSSAPATNGAGLPRSEGIDLSKLSES